MTMYLDHSKGSALILGAGGVVGRAALQMFEELPNWRVAGVSRRGPTFDTRADWLRLDLADPEDCSKQLSAVAQDVTHVVYAALYEGRDLVSGWTERRQIDVNLAMLKNALVPLLAARSVRHVTLLQGTKAYGVHHGPYKMPAKEGDPRFIASNFYYEQEDFLRAAMSDSGGYTCGASAANRLRLRGRQPHERNHGDRHLCGYLPGTRPTLSVPGGAACFQEAVDARLSGESDPVGRTNIQLSRRRSSTSPMATAFRGRQSGQPWRRVSGCQWDIRTRFPWPPSWPTKRRYGTVLLRSTR